MFKKITLISMVLLTLGALFLFIGIKSGVSCTYEGFGSVCHHHTKNNLVYDIFTNLGGLCLFSSLLLFVIFRNPMIKDLMTQRRNRSTFDNLVEDITGLTPEEMETRFNPNKNSDKPFNVDFTALTMKVCYVVLIGTILAMFILI